MDMAALVAENTELRRANEALSAALSQAQERIRALEERLGQTSRNSSKPPSSDGPAVKRPPRGRKTGRKRGAQGGHKGQGRALVPIEQVDEIIECVPEVCAKCGATMMGIDPTPERHQVVDIPEPVVIVREYRLNRRRCGTCDHVTVGKLPAGVTLSRFGPRLHALVVLLTGGWLLSKRQVMTLLRLLYGLEVSTGGVSGMERRMARALEHPVAAATEHVRQAQVAHADETSWREAKSRAWLWVAATQQVQVFLIQCRRNSTAAKSLLGESFAGALCVDRWSAYTWVGRRGLCWAHLLRDFQAMTERGGSRWHGERLVAAGQRVLGAWTAWHAGEIDRAVMMTRIEPERKVILRLLEQGKDAIWLPKKTRGVCRQLLLHQDAMWRFVEVPDLPPTNNLAERCLRRPVLWRKGSFGTDSADGSRFAERILTVVATLRAQERDPFAYLVDAHLAFASGQLAPSLLPIISDPT